MLYDRVIEATFAVGIAVALMFTALKINDNNIELHNIVKEEAVKKVQAIFAIN